MIAVDRNGTHRHLCSFAHATGQLIVVLRVQTNGCSNNSGWIRRAVPIETAVARLPRFTGSIGAVTVFGLDHGFAAHVDTIGQRRCSRARRRLAVASVPLDSGAIGDFN